MTPERWRSVQALFHAALAHTPAERTAFLEQRCEGDTELRDTVLRMLAADADTAALLPGWPVQPDALIGAGDSEGGAGERIGVYRIERELGRGGMGTVYLAEREDVGKRVALKRVRGGLTTPERRKRFLREQSLLARLEHPHIASLLDAGVTEDGMPYFVMELVEGERLDVFCDARRLTVPERLALFAQVCAAVQHAHRSQVVHRDLKPSNILVRASSPGARTGWVKLLDFGIAELLGDEISEPSDATGVRFRFMTPEYAAPEQHRGEPVTAATDVYALGVVLYELLSGHRPCPPNSDSAKEARCGLDTTPMPPSRAATKPAEAARFDGTPTQGILPDAVSAARGTSPAALGRALRGDLDTIVLKALEPEPAQRYASAQQLLDDVERYLQRQPIAARPPTRSYRAHKFVQRHRLGVAVAAVVAMLSLGTGTALALQQIAAARALREADKAGEAIALLVRMMDASDPKQTPDHLVSAPTVLAFGERGVATLERFPDTQAQILTVIGRAYTGLGLYDQAKAVFEQALTLRRSLHAGDHPDVATSLWWVGVLRTDEARFDEGAELLRESLDMRRRLFRPDHPQIVESLMGLGYLLRQRGDLQEAEAIARQALALAPEGLNGGRSISPDPALLIGGILVAQDRFTEAELYFRIGHARGLAAHDADHPWTLMALGGLGDALQGQGRLDEAEALLREVIERGIRVQGELHPRVGTYLQQHASVQLAKGSLPEAEASARRALSVQRRSLRPGHYWTVPTLITLGRTLIEAGRPAEAEPFLVEAVAVAEAGLPPGHALIAWARSELGAAVAPLGRIAGAESSPIASPHNAARTLVASPH